MSEPTNKVPACPNPACRTTDGSKRMGHEVRGVYDGVLFWSCMACGHVWPRNFGERDRLNRAAAKAVAELLSPEHVRDRDR